LETYIRHLYEPQEKKDEINQSGGSNNFNADIISMQKLFMKQATLAS
jgi:hypothetical protein